MLHYSVTVCTEQVSERAPILLRGQVTDLFKDASELGYDAIELQLRDPNKIDSNMIIDHCKKYNIAISAIATGLEATLSGLTMIDDNDDRRALMLSKLKEHIDLAKKFGCLVIIGCVRGNIPSGSSRSIYWKRFDNGMNELAEYANAQGVTLVLEAINFYVNNYLNTVAETVAYLDRLGCANVKLHIDTHHMNIEDDNMIEAVRLSAKHLGYVHFAGYNRLYPKNDRIPYAVIQNELRQMDYSGYISLECIPVPDPYTAAKRGLLFLKNI